MHGRTRYSFDALARLDVGKLSYLSPDRLELVYAQSESFVTYLIGRFSLSAMKTVLKELHDGKSIYRAMKDVLYADLETLAMEWKQSLKER